MFLNCHTGYSFKYGTMPVESLFNEARRCGVHKLALTEINNTASYMEMLRICNASRPTASGKAKFAADPYTLDLAVGIDFRRQHEQLYIAIAADNFGFETINRFLSYHNRAGKSLPVRAPELENTFVIYPYGRASVDELRPNEFIGIRRHELLKFASMDHSAAHENKYVILHPVTLLAPDDPGKTGSSRDYNIHRLLRAISHNTLLSKLPPHVQAREDEFMIPEGAVKNQFERLPWLIANTEKLLGSCSIVCEQGKDKNKKFFRCSQDQDLQYLREETRKGYHRVYGADQSIWNERIEKELSIIERKEFTSYYLITYDLINFAKSRNYDFVGRGSGANSTVAYCLGITNVDPIELDLYFERFLNEERTSPPDFDIDFSWDNRDAIYDYLFEKYGADHVCLLGTHVTYQWRSILRELAKVFGLPKHEIDELADDPQGVSSRDHITELVYKYATYIVERGLPANLSIHAGGVLITEQPIYAFTATEMPPKGYPVSHFEMHNAEDFGIYKFDILSQRGLGHIKETVRHIKRNRGVNVDVHRFSEFKQDLKIRRLLRESRTLGCFYVESPAMRMLLGKLRCEDYITLVAASSIIRPGVASSGMMRAYIERFHAVRQGKTYQAIHPVMDALMKETYGVMVYQEDVIKVAHHFAGITLTEADVLRRGMSGKYRSREEFERVKHRFFEQCEKRHYPAHVTERVWYEIESFSGYSFAKGHSASYAVESYQSLYLKAHFPLEFMVGVINNFGGFYRTEFYFHEARMNGGAIEAPCVNKSEYLTTIDGTRIYIGFVHLKSLENRLANSLITERTCNGPYTSLHDFLLRNNIALDQTRILIRIGAFRFTGKSKQHLLWEAMLYFNNVKEKRRATALFNTQPKGYPLPHLQRLKIEDAFDEIELLGFPLCDPFDLLASAPRGDCAARELMSKIGHSVQMTGYVVTTKDARTKNGTAMYFGTFLDCHGEVFDTVHFPDAARKYPFRGRGFYAIRGKVVEDFGVATVEVSSMQKLPIVNKRAEQFMQEQFPEPTQGLATRQQAAVPKLLA
ncbi:MAG TPA: DNA polymerase III subunit alpha [Chryseosolibacter sp.]|nr:DNA polymerase III subunit alpha [Chryseosolibacter sp.]